MDVSFLIDPLRKTVTSVPDGYARAAELIGTDTASGSPLWSEATDPDASVEVITADDSLTNEPLSRGFFMVTLTRDGVPYERLFAGKAILNAYGNPPSDIKDQVKTLKAARERVRFLGSEDALLWFEQHAGGAPFNLDGSTEN
ncbi:hypothetical protein F6X40_36505 [Paraburkholderia sp. UCT31]|uniref:hypothetical protein n=2 Tax=unclassified Paraburkholderia TaxID=2615204 RepID=UPI001655C92B|nr:hypothetical protein [Paraburkholderia sp. UCT31]MBC8742043.1 hypothetical protein [Paraburkholderia sp. UCT31]